MIAAILRFLGGGIIQDLTGKLARAYEMKLAAENSIDRTSAELDIKRLENALAMARLANEDRWSATSLGRYFIVIPFGVWYSAIMLDSTFSFSWDVLALPDRIMALSEWLFPVIVVGDVGKYIFRRRG